MKIAIASSGLGHVARGIETWALDTAAALISAGVDVTLYSGATLDSGKFQGQHRTLPCWRRSDRRTRLLRQWMPGPAWRWGLKSDYGIEQATFWRSLEPHLRVGHFDILHVQDPMLAFWCRRARAAGRLQTREILAHGTEEPSSFLKQFQFVQHLAPWHQERVEGEVGAGACWTALPNFVDCRSFRSPIGDEKAQARKRWGVSTGAKVVGCVAAIKRDHKRLDHLINEFIKLSRNSPSAAQPWELIIAGARTSDTEVIEAMASAAGGSIRILTDLSRDDMPALYWAMDLFVLPSLFEMMPIALLEALATGLPTMTHTHPVLDWMAGEGGRRIDMKMPGILALELQGMTGGWLAQAASQARNRAETVFDEPVVIQGYLAYYRRVLEHGAA